MKDLTKIGTLLAFCAILAGCNTPFGEIKTPFDDVEKTPEYQQAKQQISSGVEYIGDKTNEFIESNPQAQKLRDAANEKIDTLTEEAKKQYENAKEKAIDIGTKAQEEAKKQYEQTKESAKESIKDAINKKVDEAFDKI